MHIARRFSRKIIMQYKRRRSYDHKTYHGIKVEFYKYKKTYQS